MIAAAAQTMSADVLGFGAGVGSFMGKISGEAQYEGDRFKAKDAGLDKSNNIYAWAYLEHFVPILPNLRVDLNKFSEKGDAQIPLKFGGQDFAANAATDLKADTLAITAYYNLPIPLVDLRLGLSALNLDAKLKVAGAGAEKSASGSGVLPTLYLGARFDIPAAPIGLEADAKYVSYDGSRAADYRVKADLTLEFLLKFAVEVGYRQQEIVVKDKMSGFDGELDIKIAGAFAGVSARF